MAAPFRRAGTLSPEAYTRRRDRTTAQQLGLLFNSTEFTAWQEQKAGRDLKRRAASNVLLAVACVALIVALAALRPAPTQARGHVALH